jgi:hypothetical protein
MAAHVESHPAAGVVEAGLHEYLQELLDHVAAVNDALSADIFEAPAEIDPCATA